LLWLLGMAGGCTAAREPACLDLDRGNVECMLVIVAVAIEVLVCGDVGVVLSGCACGGIGGGGADVEQDVVVGELVVEQEEAATVQQTGGEIPLLRLLLLLLLDVDVDVDTYIFSASFPPEKNLLRTAR